VTDIGPKDTTAWAITRQILDHSFGNDEDLEDDEFLNLCQRYYEENGSWEEIQNGDYRLVKLIESLIEQIITGRSEECEHDFVMLPGA